MSKYGCARAKPSSYCGQGKKSSEKSGKSRSRSTKSEDGHLESRRKSSKSRRKSPECRDVKSKEKKGEIVSRKRKGMISKKKLCARPGPLTNNPFLNFLRVYRTRKCGWTVRKVAVEGAKVWCSMGPGERKQFYVEACKLQHGKRGKGKLRKIRETSRRRR
ncbi:hypothetical protein JTB14_027420 [Gonioctena quinquepunctata]|nr:hypothetical protein JTB14_027420 [Gonioctena quinquepunctata]